MVRFQLLLSVIDNQQQCSVTWIATDAAAELITGVWIGAPAYLPWLFQYVQTGETALYQAACNGKAETAMVLLANGADPNISSEVRLYIIVNFHRDGFHVIPNNTYLRIMLSNVRLSICLSVCVCLCLCVCVCVCVCMCACMSVCAPKW